MLIALFIVFTKEITFLSSLLVIFDKKNNISAKLLFEIFIFVILSIFKNKYNKSRDLFIVCKIYYDRIG